MHWLKYISIFIPDKVQIFPGSVKTLTVMSSKLLELLVCWMRCHAKLVPALCFSNVQSYCVLCDLSSHSFSHYCLVLVFIHGRTRIWRYFPPPFSFYKSWRPCQELWTVFFFPTQPSISFPTYIQVSVSQDHPVPCMLCCMYSFSQPLDFSPFFVVTIKKSTGFTYTT